MTTRRLAAVLLAAVAGLVPGFAHAFPTYQFRVPNVAYAPGDGGDRVCITCHNNPNGGPGCAPGVGAADPAACLPAEFPTYVNTPPCLNCFGAQFRSNGFQWDATLANMDADNDGFANGYELQDQLGEWTSVEPRPGNPDYVTRPGFSNSTPGAVDEDNDGYCWAGTDGNDDGDCLDSGENTASWDCDDDENDVNSGQTQICTEAIDHDCRYGPPMTDPECVDFFDLDSDSFCVVGRDLNDDGDCLDASEDVPTSDCNDDNPTAFPGANENCIDTVDNDCDMNADLADDECTCESGDGDMDGYCALGQDLSDPLDGDCTDGGECAVMVSDCDNTIAAISPAATEDCTDDIDNNCNGDLDFADDVCADFADDDNDGWCTGGRDLNNDEDCADEDEDEATWMASDCDDDDPLAYPEAMEICTSVADNDCDGTDGVTGLEDTDCVGYLDTDDDRYCEVGFDANNDGDCADEDEQQGGTDCNDMDAVINWTASEVCLDGIDNNCDDSIDGLDDVCSDYFDADRDGFCEIGQDLNDDLTCDDADEQVGSGDAAPDDPTINPNADEHCLDMKDNDQDGAADFSDDDCTFEVDADMDGYCPIGQDLNEDGDCLDDGENRAVSDCNESDEDIHPDGNETMVCNDYVDNDCDEDWDLLDSDCFFLLDLDADGYCGQGIDDNHDGDCLDASEDRFGEDCEPRNPDISPREREDCFDTIDNDCDSNVDFADSNCVCNEDADCDDEDECTVDMCVDDDCVWETAPMCGGDAGAGDDGGGGGCGCVTAAGREDWAAPALTTMLLGIWLAVRRRRTR